MATRKSTRQAEAPATGAPPVMGFAAQQMAATGFTAQVLRLPGPRGPWTYMINPAKLVCRNKKIVPVPAKAWMEAGFMNNTAGGVGQGMMADLESRGFVRIPHNQPAIAFGQPTVQPGTTATDRQSTYLNKHVGVGADGKGCVRWSDVWERPRSLGALTMWDRDNDGRDDWLISCLPLITPGGLEDIHIRLAVEPVLRRAYALLDRADTPRGLRLLLAQLDHVPDEHLPEDLRSFIKEHRKAS